MEKSKNPKPVIIIAIADYRTDQDLHLRKLGRELDGIAEGLRPAVEAEVCEIVSIAEASVEKIVAAFTLHHKAVVGFHFAGHNNGYDLLMAKNVRREGLAVFLGRQENLKFVFLNACATSGHVAELHKQGVPAVIATAQDIFDEVAMKVAHSFYSCLGKGMGIESAFYAYQSAEEIKEGALRGIKYRRNENTALSTFPWKLSYQKGKRPKLSRWNLASEADRPLFGLPALAANHSLPSEPFMYFRPYDANQARLFFGRGAEIRRLYDCATNSSLNSIILFYGQSGVGKSSLLNAGLLPRLESDFHVQYIRRGKNGVETDLLNLLGTKKESVRKAWIEKEKEKSLLIIIDQMEEVFTQPGASSNQELNAFLNLCASVFADPKKAPQGKLLLSYRKEYHPEIQRALEQKSLSYTPFFLERLSRSGIMEAVMGVAQDPALQQQYRLEIEENVAALVADDLLTDPDSPAAPVLQVLLTRMWEEAEISEGGRRVFTEKLYRKLQREGVLLSVFLEKEIRKIEEKHPEWSRSGLLLDLLFFFTTKKQTAALRSKEELNARYPKRKEQIDQLTRLLSQRRILLNTSAAGANQASVLRLAHDVLAPLIHIKYLSSDLAGQQARRILDNIDWKAWKENPKSHLLSEGQLQIVSKGLDGMGVLNEQEKRLKEESEKNAAQKKRKAKVITAAFAVAGVLLFLMLIILGKNERRKARDFQARYLATKAMEEADNSPRQALNLLNQSLNLSPKDPVLWEQYYQIYREKVLFEDLLSDSLWLWDAAAFSPDGRQLFLARSQGAAIAVNRFQLEKEAYQMEQELPGASLNLYSLAYAPTSSYIFGGSPNQKSYLWNANGNLILSDTMRRAVSKTAVTTNGVHVAWTVEGENHFSFRSTSFDAAPKRSPALSSHPTALRFFPNSKILLFGLENGKLGWWELESDIVHETEGHSAKITEVSIDQKGSRIASGDENGEVTLWQWTTGLEQSGKLPNLEREAGVLTFAEDDLCLFSADKSGKIFIWNTQSKRLIRTLDGHKGEVLAMTFDAENNFLYSAGADQKVRRWPLQYIAPAQVLIKEGPPIYSLASDLSNKTLIAGVADRRVHAWNLENPSAAPTFYPCRDRVTAVALSPDGKWLLAGDRRGWIREWDLANTEPLREFRIESSKSIRSLAISSDGSKWAAGSESPLIYLYQKGEEGLQDTLNGNPGGVRFVQFSADGAQLAATGVLDSAAKIWRLKSKERRVLTQPDKELIGVLEIPSKNKWVGASRQGGLYFWNSAGALEKQFVLPETGLQTAMAVHPQAACIATGTEEGAIYLWSQDGHVFNVYRHGSGAPIESLLFSRDGQYLYAAGARGELFRWKVKIDPSASKASIQ